MKQIHSHIAKGNKAARAHKTDLVDGFDVSNAGFVMVRHVSNEITNRYWNECCRCIQSIYSSKVRILIIDNDSNYEYVKQSSNLDMENITVVKSEYEKCGEIVGYYYFYKMRPFHRAVILHDTMFVKQNMNFAVDDVKFMWHFSGTVRPSESTPSVRGFLESMGGNLTHIYDHYNWVGCMGTASVITHSFLSTIVEKYDFFNKTLPFMNVKPHREAIERVFAIACISLKPSLLVDPSVFGDIYEYYGSRHFDMRSYDFNSYLADSRGLPFIKVWSLRPETWK